MEVYGASWMLLSLNIHDIAERDIRSFYIVGGMVICLSRKYNGSITIDGKKYSLEETCLAVLPEKHLFKFTKSIGHE